MRRPTITRPTTGRNQIARAGLTVTVLAGAGLALAACGTSSTGGAGGSASGANAAATGQGGIHAATTSLGKVLVDPKGFTVYMFAVDKMNKSNCNAACLHYWPAVKPQSAGMKASGVTGKLGSTKTPTGSPIATINGMPLYTYVGDHAPGNVNGQGFNGFGGLWWAVSPSGHVIKGSSSGSSGGSGGSGGGGGYGGY